MTLSQWCYIIPDPVVVGAGPVTEGEWVEGDEGDAPPDGAQQHPTTGPAQTHDQRPRGHRGG